MPGWLRCFHARPFATTRLVCLPHAGGSAAFYRSWATAIAPDLELYAVQYPGRADRLDEPLIGNAGELVRRLAEGLAPLLDRPFALFGHSMGARIGYELSRLLEAGGTPPVHLFVSASMAPHDENREEPIAHRDDDTLVNRLRRLGGSDADALANPELRELVLPYVRNDLRLVENYRYAGGPPLAAPITALAGDGDPLVAPEDPKRWAELTRGAFALRILQGDHFYLIPQRDAVLAEIAGALGPA